MGAEATLLLILPFFSIAAGVSECEFPDGQWAGGEDVGACYNLDRLLEMERVCNDNEYIYI